jgi:phage terminase large subunit-like protein
VASRRRKKQSSELERLVKTKSDHEALREGCYFDLAAAERFREFARRFLRHSKGQWAGQPFELLEWQWEDVIKPLFGWRRPDGTRRFRRAYIEIPKKNGKSTLAAAIGLYMLCGDGEQGAEVYSFGSDRDQARIVHNEAIQMVRASPDLSELLRIHGTTHTIFFDATNSKYAALASDPRGVEGINAHAIIADELHAWKDRQMYSALQYAGRARSQPLLLMITTAGDDSSTLCREIHDYAEGVLKGDIVDTRFFTYIRAASPDDDPSSPATWRKANPSLGVTLREDDIAADYREATRSPRAMIAFLRYTLNVWVTAETSWISPTAWDACKATYTEDDLAGEECWLGLDLARTTALTAATLVFPVGNGDGYYRVLAKAWLPERYLELAECRDEVRDFARQGLITITRGDVVDYEKVLADISTLAEKFRIAEVVYDPWNAEAFTQRLETELGIPRLEFRQTIRNYAPICKEFERLVLAKQIQHNGNPLLSWQVKHCTVKQDASGNLRPVRPGGDRSGLLIDNVVAMLMALARATQVMGERGQGTTVEFV